MKERQTTSLNIETGRLTFRNQSS